MPSARLSWHTALIAVLTAGLVWLFISQIDLAEAGRAIRRADPVRIVVALGFTLLTYFLRAVRWRVLLAPIGHTRFRTAFRTTVIGFTAMFFVGRVGELLRPYLLARQEGLGPTACFATVVVERLLDVCTVLLLFGVAILLVPVDVGPEARGAGIAAGGIAVFALVVLAIGAGHPERLSRLASAVTSWLPAKLARAVGGLVHKFAGGLAVMRSPGHLAVAAIWSLPLWLSIACGIWFTTRAFDLALPVLGSLLVVGYLALGVSAPTPGGVGGFHWAYLLAMTQLFGADDNTAGAAALVLHALSFVPVTLLGLAFMWQDGLTIGRLKGLRGEDV